MATLKVLDSQASEQNLKESGSGTPTDPFVPSVNVDSGVVSVVPASPAAGSYLPVRLTDGAAFYVASGGSGGTVDTELPVAAALADAAANPTTPLIGACLLVWNGATFDRLRAANIGKDLAAVAGGTIVTVWTPASGKRPRLMSGSISVSAACSVLFEDNSAGTTVFRTPRLLADTPYSFDLGAGYLLAAANNVLKMTTSAAANVTGTLRGTEE